MPFIRRKKTPLRKGKARGQSKKSALAGLLFGPGKKRIPSARGVKNKNGQSGRPLTTSSSQQAQAFRASGKKNSKRYKKPNQSKGVLRRFAMWSCTFMIWAMLGLAAVLAWYARDLPDISKIGAFERRPGIHILAKDGQLLSSYGDWYGEPLQVSQISPYLSRAVLAIEDRRFYRHFGVDPIGLSRAMIANMRAGRIVQGGSTITQQLAKNVFLSPEQTMKRKIQEVMLAFWLEYKFSKNQILYLYLNRVYFGARTYGVDAAAKRYFNKSARDLNLYESALIAGSLKAPSRLSPVPDNTQAQVRAQVVLGAMADVGFISEGDAQIAAQNKVRGEPGQAYNSSYFTDWIMAEVDNYIGDIREDIIVHTTLDPHLQAMADNSLQSVLEENGEARKVGQGAVVVLDPYGGIIAMAGGKNYEQSQFNRATQARRQPGSSFKPFVFQAAFEAGYAPRDTITDTPLTIATKQGPWRPQNYNNRYFGEVSLKKAFARSLNSVAVQLQERLTRQKVIETAQKMGIRSPLQPTPSLALGVNEVSLLELTAAYAPYANGGEAVWPHGIRQVNTRSNTIFYQRDDHLETPVMSHYTLAAMTDILRSVIRDGTGKAADPGRPAGGKTGTSQDFRDAWFVGFTAELVVGVWTGNDDNSPMKKVSGGTLPAQIWKDFIKTALADKEALPLPGSFFASELRQAPPPSADKGKLQGLLEGLFGSGISPNKSSSSNTSHIGGKRDFERR